MAMASPPHDASLAEPEYYGSNILLEEESFSWYNRDAFYPVRIGEVFQSRYKVLVKLGYGSVSTVWLCRDLQTHEYVTVKVYMTGHRQSLNEVQVLEHFESLPHSGHPGSKLVRRMLASFQLGGVTGPHTCIVHRPLSLSLRGIRNIAGGKIPGELLKSMVYGMLLGLDYLHSEARVVHTDIQEGNVMLSILDDSILDEVVQEEVDTPSPRRRDGDRTIYSSVELDIPDDPGEPIFCDFGDAQVGQGPFEGEVMPDLYRAPEIILRIPWDEKIDIWSFGLMIWDLLQGKHLFNERLPSREESSAAHLAKMVSLLGPPPKDLMERSEFVDTFFNNDGSLKTEQSTTSKLADEEEVLDGEENAQFLSFVSRMLQWRPEDRASAMELLEDPWLQFLSS